MQSNVVLRLSLRGKAKSGKMFGSPLAPSPRRRHSHHLKRRAREERGEMGEEGSEQPRHTAPEQQHITARSQNRKKKKRERVGEEQK